MELNHSDILKILERRARTARIIMTIFIYLLLTSIFVVIYGIISIKKDNNNGVSNLITNYIYNEK
ncbi:hypothetical protein C9426_19670 [Serratia sp. S1B]|nr:hypothetical protein C9426_19670 [Serratia sp. S1B]